MLTYRNHTTTLKNQIRQSPTETTRRYLHELYRLRTQARLMGNYKVARAIAILISRVDPGRTE